MSSEDHVKFTIGVASLEKMDVLFLLSIKENKLHFSASCSREYEPLAKQLFDRIKATVDEFFSPGKGAVH